MNESEIVEAARQIDSAAARKEYLDRVCGEDSELRTRIEAAIAAASDSPLPETVDAATVLQAGEPANVLSPVPDFGAETASTRVGDYRLIEPIGQGGMGSVWLAEQVEPVKRAVALKVIKAGMDTAAVIARFEAERQALARMSHPNIAKVLDAGAADSGRPFFVMELVQGVPVTDYCDARRLSNEHRLGLFCTVCHAIQHAHQKGVIHRDIKPSNVLVTEIDGEPVVKVIDFGLAKATDARLTEKSLFTQLGQMVGTPAYMSPEQAEADLDIDTRTDVYSLGVLLYELLTGVTPLDIGSLRAAGYSEVQRMIREFEPPRMSQRLSSLESPVMAADSRSTDSRRLASQLRGDLDVIAMKALEKDRDRRYETPSHFAADIQRFLKREAIEARPASTWYRMQKFFIRNRVAVGTTATVAAALFVGTVVSLWQASLAREAADVATRANEKAQKRLQQVERGAAILGSIFNDIDLRRIEGDGKTLEQVLGERLKEASAQLTNDAIADAEVTARLQVLLGDSLYNLGHYEESIELLREATATRGRLLGPDDPETLAARHNLAECYVLAGKYQLAISIHEDTLERSERALGPTHADTLASIKDLGNAHIYNNDFDSGIPLLEKAERLCRTTLGEKDHLTMTAINSLAFGYASAEQSDKALPLYTEALTLRREVYGNQHYDTMTAMNNLAAALYGVGDVEKALPLMEEVYKLRRGKLGAEHPHTIISMTNLAVVLEGAGRGTEALPYFEEAVAISESKNGPNHPGTLIRLRNLANCVRDLGEIDRALGLYHEYVDRHEATDGKDSLAYANALIYLGFNQVRQERWAEAEPVLRECLALRIKHLEDGDWQIGGAQSLLGATLMALDKLEEAEPLLLSGYEVQKAQEEKMPPSGRAGITQALDRIIAFYEKRNADGDTDRLARWNSERNAKPPQQ